MAKKKSTRKRSTKKSGERNGANLGFEQKLWLAADKHRKINNCRMIGAAGRRPNALDLSEGLLRSSL
ncbi:MAG: hypothetical protein ACQESR_29850 [Planctomycetota bacterium]